MTLWWFKPRNVDVCNDASFSERLPQVMRAVLRVHMTFLMTLGRFFDWMLFSICINVKLHGLPYFI